MGDCVTILRMSALVSGLIATTLGALLLASPCHSAESGLQVTPDGKTTLVSKDVTSERWAIALNSTDHTLVGNVFRQDGGDPAFVWCEPLESSSGRRFSCWGADRCEETPCATQDWTFISEIELPTSFFLPAAAMDPAFGARGTIQVSSGRSAGVQITRDGRRNLVSKDVSGERWAIVFDPADGSVTGNVFRPGAAPQFVWCSLEHDDGNPDPEQILRTFSCFGAEACTTQECTGSSWQAISEVVLPGSFFLPPKRGLPGGLERVSINTEGRQGDGASGGPAISADGRYVAFSSEARNLVDGDTNNVSDVFVRDRLTGATERVSVASDGRQSDRSSSQASISADGRFIVFASDATTLVASDSNGVADIFVHDRLSGKTELVSRSDAGGQGDRNSQFPAISADGHVIVFYSEATNLVPGDGYPAYSLFIRDLVRGTIEIIGDSNPLTPSISGDGSFVAFALYPFPVVGCHCGTQIFVYDRGARSIELLSTGIGGEQADAGSLDPSMSIDGRFVAFTSTASNLIPADTNNGWDVFVYDRSLRTIERVSTRADGTEVGGSSLDPSISGDGRIVAFSSQSTFGIEGDESSNFDVYAHDRLNGLNMRVSIADDGTGGLGEESATDAAVSSDGRCVAFVSGANGLVPTDDNGFADVFVRCGGN